MLAALLVTVTKHLRQLKKGRAYFGAQLESTVEYSPSQLGTWQQEWEAAGHIAPVVSKQRQCSCSACYVLIQPRSPGSEMLLPHSK